MAVFYKEVILFWFKKINAKGFSEAKIINELN